MNDRMKLFITNNKFIDVVAEKTLRQIWADAELLFPCKGKI